MAASMRNFANAVMVTNIGLSLATDLVLWQTLLMTIRRQISTVWRIIKRNLILSVGIVVLVLLLVDITFGMLNAHEQFTWQKWAQDFYANIATELASIFVTVVVIGLLFERRQEGRLKEQLIRDMGGQVNHFSLRAVRELRENGWLIDGSLEDAYLGEANLKDANLMQANLRGALLWRANLEGADLSRTNLNGTDSASTNLKGANFWRASLVDANFSTANFEGALLWEANLEGVNLCGANLKDANLDKTNLSHAYLQEANLEGTNLWDADFSGVQYDNRTTWPENFDPLAVGLINTDSEWDEDPV